MKSRRRTPAAGFNMGLATWVLAAGVARLTGADLVELKTELPPVYLEGTPVEIKVANLAPEETKPPTIMVPPGTTNVAKGKPVKSSDDFIIIGDITAITDGDKEGGEGYYVEIASGLQWVQLDLGAPQEIHAIWLWHYHSQKRAYHDVVVQISDDPDFATGVTTVFNDDYDNSAGMGVGKDKPYVENNIGKAIKVDGVKGRFVRLYSRGNTSNEMNHYIEVEVYGKPVQ